MRSQNTAEPFDCNLMKSLRGLGIDTDPIAKAAKCFDSARTAKPSEVQAFWDSFRLGRITYKQLTEVHFR